MGNFRQWYEMSYAPSDVPSHFFLGCRINHDLVNGELHNLQGISSSFEFVVNWAWEAMLIMPAQELLKINKLSKVLYGNPDYLSSSNFKVAKRLVGGPGGVSQSYPFPIEQLLYSLFKNLPPQETIKKIKRELGDMPTRNIGDFIRNLQVVMKNNAIDLPITPEVITMVKRLLDLRMYSIEHEWVIKPEYKRIENEIKKVPVLKIPEGTICIVADAAKDNPLVPLLSQKMKVYIGRDNAYKVWEKIRNI